MNNISANQNEIISEFALFSDWMDRYQYLIDLGRKLPRLEEDQFVDSNLLQGCQSRVWLVMRHEGENLSIQANSDAAIVSGLIALIIRVYSGASAKDILESEPFFVKEIGLNDHLSATRSNGLHAMLEAIRKSAAELVISRPT